MPSLLGSLSPLIRGVLGMKIKSMKINFNTTPGQHQRSREIKFNDQKQKVIDEKIQRMLAKGFIAKAPQNDVDGEFKASSHTHAFLILPMHGLTNPKK